MNAYEEIQEKRGMWKFLKACKLTVFPHPMLVGESTITFHYGKSKDGEIGEDGMFHAYNGESLELKTPQVVVP